MGSYDAAAVGQAITLTSVRMALRRRGLHPCQQVFGPGTLDLQRGLDSTAIVQRARETETAQARAFQSENFTQGGCRDGVDWGDTGGNAGEVAGDSLPRPVTRRDGAQRREKSACVAGGRRLSRTARSNA